MIEAMLKSMPKAPGTKAPRKKEIIDIFANDDVLSPILAREGAVRSYEKVKTMLIRSSI